ncbi:deoxyribodipyrimidine photo-lyase [Haloarculaceae archaeon H-GB2-1]|nr:deoxyribodipyrimidine photo-lyase [Haloarculaceae archaeon H-GB1-1]MEA5386002.1 deoxyribodipyrimidine photo-lyase [Haloarculaceae archaeon H-GB11]MEA5407506.1 deoxyribodipyrimidine photo-lyase [Haloarculaceae archaeon H-GB2-1]
MRLHWHRRDLRATDNRGLTADEGPTVPVFVFDRDVLAHAGPPRVAFLLDALASLRTWYRERGSDLLVVEGDPAERLADLVDEHDADTVSWCRDYSGLARQRDQRVEAALGDAVTVDRVHDALLHEPGTITTNGGETYSVFSYFGKKWLDRAKDDPVESPSSGDLAPVSGGDLPTLESLGFGEPEATVPAAGTDAARRRLDAFCADAIYRYADQRDYPACGDRDEASGCTSRLSSHLKFGTIGIREVYAATDEAWAAAETETERDSVTEFQRQLAWREFYAHVLSNQPGLVTENFKTYEHEIAWRDDTEGLRAWKNGETGYPIVDAGMRQLRDEAWMHNRVRMLVASFLTKDLLIDWREGYDWFREKLVDHDTANDVGGWQWAASTGTDAQPYFRVFNPMTQGERYDPDAEYVTQYVPELRDVPAHQIHRWHELDVAERRDLAPAYPDPIVDHAEARERALAAFEAASDGS